MSEKSKIKGGAKSNLIKFRASASDLNLIDELQKEAGYPTRAAYILACATRGSQADLTQIARGIGSLGIMCNALLDAGPTRHAELVRAIFRTCDQISLSLYRSS